VPPVCLQLYDVLLAADLHSAAVTSIGLCMIEAHNCKSHVYCICKSAAVALESYLPNTGGHNLDVCAGPQCVARPAVTRQLSIWFQLMM
jgi:hypothetical protein